MVKLQSSSASNGEFAAGSHVASRDRFAGTAGYAAYSVSKSAVLPLTEALADELKNSKIKVNCIMPGTIDTPQKRAAMPEADFSKCFEPSALADVILFLASDAAQAVNGAAIPVYGKAQDSMRRSKEQRRPP